MTTTIEARYGLGGWVPNTLGLDEISDRVVDGMEFRNERESGYGDDEGDWFAAIEDHEAQDGQRYHILFLGTHGNDHSPMTSGNTWAEVYPVDEVDAFRSAVEAWESKPERVGDDD